MKNRSNHDMDLAAENERLRARLEEAEDTLRAIRAGEVDALVMGEQIYSLQSADTPYRTLIEAINEGAAALAEDGSVLYSNRRLAELLRTPLEEIIGSPLRRFVEPPDQQDYDRLLERGRQRPAQGLVNLQSRDHPAVPVQLSINVLATPDIRGVCVVVTDLTERQRVEETLHQRAGELAIFNAAAVGRELRMIELKQEVNELARQLGAPPRYDLEELEAGDPNQQPAADSVDRPAAPPLVATQEARA